MYYKFPDGYTAANYSQSVAFCVANDIYEKAPLFNSFFEVVDGYILTHEFEMQDGHRVTHDCECGAVHYGRTHGKYPLRVQPEVFGFDPLKDAAGNVIP